MNTPIKNYGFIAPVITPEHWVLGASAMPLVIRTELADWEPALSYNELQNKKFETYNCTSFNTLKQIQMYMKLVFGINVNYSDRFLGIMAGTKAPGNDPQIVCEAIRHYGLIPEEMLPFSDDLENIDEYYSFKGADREACLAEGRRWLERFEFFHEWAFGDGLSVEDRLKNMEISLKTSPLALAMYAWYPDGDGVYIKAGRENHWTLVYKIEDLKRIVQRVSDSYEPFLKIADQEINFCKRIYIERKPDPVPLEIKPEPLPAPARKSWWQKLINWILNIIKK